MSQAVVLFNKDLKDPIDLLLNLLEHLAANVLKSSAVSDISFT